MDDYQLRKDIDTFKYVLDALDSELQSKGIKNLDLATYLNSFYDKSEADMQFISSERIGFDQPNNSKFNFAVITKTEEARDGSIIQDEEFWILSNAFFDYDKKRFIKIDPEHTSFGIQIQANGSYPGEAQLGYADNVGINIWRNPKKSDVEANFPNWRTDTYYDFFPFMEDSEIGLGLQADPDYWREFGVFAGWSNSFMVDSYGGMTIGGAGFEVDGNGIFPFTRLSSSRYTDENNDVWHLLGLLDNAYHPTKWGWYCDDNSTWSWFFGLKTPEASDLVKDNTETKFVVMYNDTPHNPLDKEELLVANWNTVLEIDTSDIKAVVDGALVPLGGSGSGVVDSGWNDLAKETIFWNYSSDTKIQYRKYGSLVQVEGRTVLSDTPSQQSNLVIGQMPNGYRPQRNKQFLCQMNSSEDFWQCTVNTYGEIIANKIYGNTAFAANQDFEINIQFLVG